jgi:hypothetical protein
MRNVVLSKSTYEIIAVVISLSLVFPKFGNYLVISHFDPILKSSSFYSLLKILGQKLSLLIEIISSTNID